jgi:hypothetical protein
LKKDAFTYAGREGIFESKASGIAGMDLRALVAQLI